MIRAMEMITEPVVIFCYANTLLNKNCIIEIVKHYADLRVGGVAGGEKDLGKYTQYKTVSSGESLYWKHESFIKK